jgi:hypothetical protein
VWRIWPSGDKKQKGIFEFTFPVEFQELFGVVLCAWIFSRYVLLFFIN